MSSAADPHAYTLPSAVVAAILVYILLDKFITLEFLPIWKQKALALDDWRLQPHSESLYAISLVPFSVAFLKVNLPC